MFSQHCRMRAAQRGVDDRFMMQVLAHADVETPVSDNCRLLRVSRTRARCLNIDDRLGRYAVIWSDDHGQVVTVMPIHAGRAGRRYRKG